MEGIYGGYILFTPVTEPATTKGVSPRKRRKGTRALAAARLSSAAGGPRSGAVPLSVPYQGSSKDYSTIGQDNSLALFVPPMHDYDPTSSEALEGKPSLFLCDADGAGKCGYSGASLKASPSAYKQGFRFASTLLRPVADVKVQVSDATMAPCPVRSFDLVVAVLPLGPLTGFSCWSFEFCPTINTHALLRLHRPKHTQVWSADGKKHLGTSASQGPGGTAPPLRRTFLTANPWDGKYHPPGAASTEGPGPLQLQPGRAYRLKLELFPVLAAADRLAGRQVEQESLVVELETKLHLVDESVTQPEPGSAGSSTKASTKSRKSGGSKSKAKSRSSSSSTQTYGRSRRPAVRVQAVGINPKPYVALEL